MNILQRGDSQVGVRPIARPQLFLSAVLLLFCGVAGGWVLRRMGGGDVPASLSPGGPGEQRAGRWFPGKRPATGGLGIQPATADAAAVAGALVQADAASLARLFATVDSTAPTPLDRMINLSLVWQRWMELDAPAAMAALHARTDLNAGQADDFLEMALSDARLDPVAVLSAVASLPASARRMRWLAECTRAAIRREAAIETVLSAVPDHPAGLRGTVEAAWMASRAGEEPEAAITWADRNATHPEAHSIAAAAFRAQAVRDPTEAMRAALAVQSPFLRESAVLAVMETWSDRDPDKAREAALTLPPSPARARALARAAKQLAATDPQGALALLPQITLPEARLDLWEEIAPAVFRKDPRQALDLLEKDVPRAAHRAAAAAVIRAYAESASTLPASVTEQVQTLAGSHPDLAKQFAAHLCVTEPGEAFDFALALPVESGAEALGQAAAAFTSGHRDQAAPRIQAISDPARRAAALAGALRVISGDAIAWSAQFPADDLNRARAILRHGTGALTSSTP